MLREVAIIVFWTFLPSTVAAVAGSYFMQWPLTGTYLVAVLTIGPVLAIQRGRNREKDRLEISERAVAEILVIILLLVVGSLIGHWIGR